MTEGESRPRSLYIGVVFWGASYRRWFVEYCLRSILAPRNLAALDAGAKHALLLATTDADWAAIEHHPAMVEARRHFEVTHVPIADIGQRPGFGGEHIYYAHTSRAYARLSERCYADKVLGFMLTPDMFISDGMLLALRRRVARGANMIFVPAWRCDETKLMAALHAQKLLPDEGQAPVDATPIAIAPRPLAGILTRCVHKLETLRFWDLPIFSDVPGCSFWPVPGNGLVIFATCGMPYVDFAALAWHDVSPMGPGVSFDAYTAMFGFKEPKVETISDSDDGVIASWTPTKAESWETYRPRLRLRIPGLRDFARCAIVRSYARDNFVRALDKSVFPQPIRVHGRDIDGDYLAVERRATRLIARAVGDAFPVGAFGPDPGAPVGRPWHPWWLAMRLGELVFAPRMTIRRTMNFALRGPGVVLRAAAGDPQARRRLKQRLAAFSRR